jgi:DNA-binding MarR family transcriptional regulator
MKTAGQGSEAGKMMMGVDRTIHEPARFHVMASLSVVESADFVFLLRQTGLTAGNLSAHVNRLEAAGFLDVKKTFKGKRPQTIVKLTRKGRAAFAGYLKAVRGVLDQLRQSGD